MKLQICLGSKRLIAQVMRPRASLNKTIYKCFSKNKKTRLSGSLISDKAKHYRLLKYAAIAIEKIPSANAYEEGSGTIAPTLNCPFE